LKGNFVAAKNIFQSSLGSPQGKTAFQNVVTATASHMFQHQRVLNKHCKGVEIVFVNKKLAGIVTISKYLRFDAVLWSVWLAASMHSAEKKPLLACPCCDLLVRWDSIESQLLNASVPRSSMKKDRRSEVRPG